MTGDSEIPLDRLRAPDLEEHRREAPNDSGPAIATLGDQGLQLRLLSAGEATLEEDQREPIVPDAVSRVGEELSDPLLAVLAVVEGRQVEEVKVGVTVVREPERGVELTVQREVERQKVVAPMGEGGRQLVGHRKRCLGSDDAVKDLELLAVRVEPEEARPDRFPIGV